MLPNGIILIFVGLASIAIVLLGAWFISRRRHEFLTEGDADAPRNLAGSTNAILIADSGGYITFMNETARNWFDIHHYQPGVWTLSQLVTPSETFHELFTTEGAASLAIGDRAVEAISHRIIDEGGPRQVITMKEEVSGQILSKEDRGSAKAFKTLNELSLQIAGSLNTDEALDAILNAIQQVSPCDAAQIVLQYERDTLRAVRRIGPDEYREGVGAEITEGPTMHIFKQRQSILLDDASETQEYRRVIRPYRSFIGIPLTSRARFIGTVEVMAEETAHFDREDLFILNMLAEQAAIALDNTRLYDQQANRVTELSGMQKIAESIADLSDPERLYTQLNSHIATLMGVNYAGILLFDADSSALIAQTPFHGILDVLISQFVIPMRPDSRIRSIWDNMNFWLCNDIANEQLVIDAGLAEFAELNDINTTILVKLAVGGRVIGVIMVANKADETSFSMNDVRLLQTYAGQASIIVESSRLYVEEQSRVAELQGLQTITQTMASFTDPEEMYEQLTNRIAELLNVEVCGFLMHDPVTDRLTAQLPFYGLDELIARHYQLNVAMRGLTRNIWNTDALFASNNVFTDMRIDELGLRSLTNEANMQSILLAPLSAAGRRFGMLHVSNKTDGSDFTEDDKRILAIFAGQAAVLIDNARLYQDTDETLKKRAAELRSISRVSREINATVELGPVLEVIAAEAHRAEGADLSTLVLFDLDETGREFKPRLRMGDPIGDEALILEIAATRQGAPLSIDDFELIPAYHSPVVGMRSALISPIFYEGGVVGAISLYGRQPATIGESALEFVQTLGSQVSVALANSARHTEQVERSEQVRRRAEQLTRIFEQEETIEEEEVEVDPNSTIEMDPFGTRPLEMEQDEAQEIDALERAADLASALANRTRRLSLLNQISATLSQSLDQTSILQTVVNELSKILEADRGDILSIDPATQQTAQLTGKFPSSSDGSIEDFSFRLVDNPLYNELREHPTPIMIADIHSDNLMGGIRDFFVNNDIRSMIAVPLVVGNSISNIITIEYEDSRLRLDEEQMELIETIINQAIVSIQNARLFQSMVSLSSQLEQRVDERTTELKEERDRIDTLYRIAVELASSLDLDLVLNRALELVGGAINGQRGSLYLIEPLSEQMIQRAMLHGDEILPPGGRQIPASPNEGFVNWLLEQKGSVRFADINQEEVWSPVPGFRHGRSIIAAPLIAGFETLGFIIFTSDEADKFLPEEMRLVEAAAQQITNSINNAELYRMIREQAERLGIMLRSQQTEAAKSQAILESIADGVIVSGQTGEIILFNQAAERILSLRRDSALGRPFSDLSGIYGPGLTEWEHIIEEWEANPAEYAGEYLTQQIELGDVFISLHVSPAIHGSEYLGLVYVVRDITKEVLSDRVKTQFVANVSHELRTPLTVVKGYADLLLMGRIGDMTHEQRDYLDRIKRHADRLNALVNDLLNISRIEQGTMDLDIQEISIGDITRDVVKAMDVRAGNEEREMNFVADVAPDISQVWADPDRIAQIITNLVANAYQYTHDGGTVTVKAANSGDGIQVDIIDTGIGISKQDQEQIFDRFFRGEDPLVMQAAGTGLGLSIVQSLVEMHEGRVWLESEPGVGTTFSFWLPSGIEEE